MNAVKSWILSSAILLQALGSQSAFADLQFRLENSKMAEQSQGLIASLRTDFLTDSQRARQSTGVQMMQALVIELSKMETSAADYQKLAPTIDPILETLGSITLTLDNSGDYDRNSLKAAVQSLSELKSRVAVLEPVSEVFMGTERFRHSGFYSLEPSARKVADALMRRCFAQGYYRCEFVGWDYQLSGSIFGSPISHHIVRVRVDGY